MQDLEEDKDDSQAEAVESLLKVDCTNGVLEKPPPEPPPSFTTPPPPPEPPPEGCHRASDDKIECSLA